MRMCCITNVLIGCLCGFFLNMCFMFPQYQNAKQIPKHDHKTCQKCTCEKSCSCHKDDNKRALKCLCD